MLATLSVMALCVCVANGLALGVGDDALPPTNAPTIQRYFEEMDWYPLDCSQRSEGGRSAHNKYNAALTDAAAQFTKESASFRHMVPDGVELRKLVADRSEMSQAAFTTNYALLSAISAVSEEKRQSYTQRSVFGDEGTPLSGGVDVLDGGVWPACDYQRSASELRSRSDSPSTGYASVVDVLGHLARDFEIGGGEAREDAHALYDRVVGLAVRRLQSTLDAQCVSEGHAYLRVLVPGVGVGGLLFRLRAALSALVIGPGCADASSVHLDLVGTECSPSMLTALGWVSEWHRGGVNAPLHPWAWHQGNMLKVEDLYLPVTIAPIPQHQDGEVPVWSSVVGGDVFAGDWETANSSFRSWVQRSTHNPSDAPLQFDVVLTSYVVDAVTSSGSVTRTLDRIAALLRPTGHWVNFGPLQYHTADLQPKLSAEELQAYMKEEHGLYADRPLSEWISGAIPYSTPPTVGLMVSRHRPLLFAMSHSDYTP